MESTKRPVALCTYDAELDVLYVLLAEDADGEVATTAELTPALSVDLDWMAVLFGPFGDVYRHDRRRAALQAALADAIAQLRDAIRSGLSVQEAFVALARSGPALGRMVLGTGVEEPERQRGNPGRRTRSGNGRRKWDG
jgi:hypothetical protein